MLARSFGVGVLGRRCARSSFDADQQVAELRRAAVSKSDLGVVLPVTGVAA